MTDMSDLMKVESDSQALQAMTDEVHAWTVRKGWRGEGAKERTFGDDIALLHSEISEALEAYRTWELRRGVVVEVDTGEVFADLEDRVYPEGEKPEGVPSEFADLLIRLLDCCATYDIDLFAEYRAKMDYNETREHRHGGKNL